MSDWAVQQGATDTDAGNTPMLRGDYPHPSCRCCGDDLSLSAPGGTVCRCGWRLPEVLKALFRC